MDFNTKNNKLTTTKNIIGLEDNELFIDFMLDYVTKQRIIIISITEVFSKSCSFAHKNLCG